MKKKRKLGCYETPAQYLFTPDYFTYDYSSSFYWPNFFSAWLFIFLQVKNKPWLPWVYSWIRHRREQVCPVTCVPVFVPIAPVSVAMLVSSVSMSLSLPLFLFSSLCLCYLLNVIWISEGHTAMVHPRHVHRSVQISHWLPDSVATKLGFPHFAKHETRRNFFPVSRNFAKRI